MNENPGARLASHIGLWLVVIGLVVFLSWSAVNKKSDETTYRPGSVDASKIINYYPLSLGLMGCEYIKPDGQPLRKNDKVTVNNAH